MEETSHATRPVFADPSPMGLICLAIGCAALVPMAFGAALSPAGLHTAAMFCLFFGAGGQLLAGVMSLANHNLYGGTLFTAFSFNWLMNWWVLERLAAGVVPDHTVISAVDAAFLLVFLVMTCGFGFFSRSLLLLLVDIDLIYAFRLANALFATQVFAIPIGVTVVVLALLSLWIAFGVLLNPVAGRNVFPLGGPVWTPRNPR